MRNRIAGLMDWNAVGIEKPVAPPRKRARSDGSDLRPLATLALAAAALVVFALFLDD